MSYRRQTYYQVESGEQRYKLTVTEEGLLQPELLDGVGHPTSAKRQLPLPDL